MFKRGLAIAISLLQVTNAVLLVTLTSLAVGHNQADEGEYFDLLAAYIVASFGTYLLLFMVAFLLVVRSFKSKFPALDRAQIFALFTCILLSLIGRVVLNEVQ